ncbi:MAG: SBBP repeat-containing protein [Planctomycetota bacterium]
MLRSLTPVIPLVLACLAAGQSVGQSTPEIPSAFVPNLGQWDHAAHFVLRTPGIDLFAEPRGFAMELQAVDRVGRLQSTDVRLHFESPADAAPEPASVRGEQRQPGHHNYFLGADASRWRTGVPLYDQLHYADLYPAIDLVLRHVDQHPEYDLLLQPGADLASVVVRIEGVAGLTIGDDGSLIAHTELGPLRQPRPRTWQVAPDGSREPIACDFVLLARDRFGFAAATWDQTLPLTIDPGLLFSTVLPGSIAPLANLTESLAVSVSQTTGEITIAGGTREARFPVSAGQKNQGSDSFVTRLDPSQTGSAQLVWSTFVGGTGNERVQSMFVDDSGVITAAGQTSSTDFPTRANAFSMTPFGQGDMFVMQLDPSLPRAFQLAYSSYLGGTRGDINTDIFVDGQGIITVTGDSESFDYPRTPGTRPYMGGPAGAAFDGVITQIDPTIPGAAGATYSIYYGGTDKDSTDAVWVEADGTITLIGESESGDLPMTTDAYQQNYGGGGDAFIARLDPAAVGAGGLIYASYFGGAKNDWLDALHIDDAGIITMVGDTLSLDFPTTPGAYARSLNGDSFDSFVARFDPTQTGTAQLLYSTYIGGTSCDNVVDVAVNPSGIITIAGDCVSVNFPTTGGSFEPDALGGPSDAFVCRLDPSRTGTAQLLYSTYLGGSGSIGQSGTDTLWGLAVDPLGNATVTGTTYSDDFPITPGAYETRGIGGADAFITTLDLLPNGVAAFGTSSPGCNGVIGIASHTEPLVGETISITCSNAPPSSLGALIIGVSALPAPLPILGIDLWVDLSAPNFLLTVPSTPLGTSELPIPLPGLGSTRGATIYAQFVWAGPATPPPCPAGGLSASNALALTIQ